MSNSEFADTTSLFGFWTQSPAVWFLYISPGDVVWFPPGEKHWHGAAPTTGMSHFAIQEAHDGEVMEWLEHVIDEYYTAR